MGKLKRADGIKKINSLGVQKFVEDFVPTCFAEKSISNMKEKYLNILERSKIIFMLSALKDVFLLWREELTQLHFLEKINIPSLICLR